ncbi:MAG TPA: thioredoxin [Kiloniellaceae bacterium]|nr:thioredoxin [Kiloniellaceae bacterium]
METILGAGPNGGAQNGGEFVKDVDQQAFGQEVVQASLKTPVIVDFWAPWCGPCKQLGPLLEKAVTEARGAVILVKVNIDENQELAAQLRIQSIPTVYAFFQGQPVDGFQGAKPESEIKAFVKRLAEMAGASVGPSPVEQALEQAQAALATGDHHQALALYSQILQHEADNKAALAGLVACQLAEDDLTSARETVDALEPDVLASSEFASVMAKLTLKEKAAAAGPLDELHARIAADPKDYQARYDLAIALQAAGQAEAAADELLYIVEKNLAWNDEAARKQLLTFFEAWGPTDPVTLQARRRLSSLLFS